MISVVFGIVALTVFSAEAQTIVDLGVILGMLLVVAIIDYGVFLVSHRLDNWLTHERILVMEKLLGIMLAALAVLVASALAAIVVRRVGGHGTVRRRLVPVQGIHTTIDQDQVCLIRSGFSGRLA